jgi:peptide/nickel transport system ATP-binding protein
MTSGELEESEIGSQMLSEILLEGRDIEKRFRSFKRSFLAVRGASISIGSGEIVALVGESGSGKTTLAKILAGLLEPTSGEVFFMKKPISRMSKQELLNFRRKVQYIPQCPDLALDPMWYLYDSIAEPLRIHKIVNSRKEEFKIVLSTSSRFGLSLDHLRRKPRDLSGGELQRAVLARAMVLDPELLIADEPTSMLDPSTQAKIVDQLIEVQKERGLAVLFITHDLELAEAVSDRVYVMFSGMIVESGGTSEVFSSPMHPYTRSLIDSDPAPPEAVVNEAPCPFYSQCNISIDICRKSPPPEFRLGKRTVRCWAIERHRD